MKTVINRPIQEEHTPDGHFYRTKSGELYPSITTIFKLVEPAEKQDWYEYWVQSVEKKENISRTDAIKWCKNYGFQSMQVGTELHLHAENYLNNKGFKYKNCAGCEKDPAELFIPLQAWLDENVKGVYATECQLYSDDLRLAGTVDLIANLKGDIPCIIDFKNSRKPKTPKKIIDSHYYEQMCAYSKMWEFCTGQKIDMGIVLVVSWDGKVRPFKVHLPDYESSLWDWILRYESLI